MLDAQDSDKVFFSTSPEWEREIQFSLLQIQGERERERERIFAGGDDLADCYELDPTPKAVACTKALKLN